MFIDEAKMFYTLAFPDKQKEKWMQEISPLHF